MASNKAQILKMQQAAKAVEKSAGKGLQSLIDSLTSMEQLAGQAKRINQKVAIQLQRYIRDYLRQNFAASNVQSHTGKLFAAACEAAFISVTDKALTVRLAPSGGEKLYRYAAAVNYGRITDKGLTSRQKKKIKSAAEKGGHEKVEGVNHVPAKKFFFLSDAQKEELQEVYIRLWQEEINKTLARFKKRGGGR